MQPLNYVAAAEDGLPGQGRPSRVSAGIGQAALWLGIASWVAAIVALPGVFGFGSERLLTLFAGAVLAAVVAIILGTIGRLSRAGRRAATNGRRLGGALLFAPFALFLFGMIFLGEIGNAVALAAVFFIVFMFGLLLLVVADTLIGSD